MRTLIPGLFCFLLAGKLLLVPSSAQQLSFSHLGVNNGLSQGVNNCTYKDSRGFIWISSFDGLNRFDGLNCRIYRETGTDKISIKGTLFLNILEDRSGNLWIGSNKGLNCYDRRSDRFVNYQMPGRALVDQFFSPFYIDDQNKVWLQSRAHIILFDPAVKQFTLLYTFPQTGNLLVKSKPALPYQSLQEIYIVVNNTPVINIATVRKNLFTWQAPVNISHPDITRVNYFLPDGRGSFWLATNDGLFYFNRTSQYLQPVLNKNEKLGNTIVLDFDSSGRLWTGSQQQGLYLTDTASRKVLEQYYPDGRNPYGLSGQQVLYIHSDAQNYLWVAIWGKGIDYVNPDRFRFNHYLTRETASEKGIDNFIRSIVQVAPNEIWAATQSSGILVLNEKKEFITGIRQPLPATIEHLYKDSHANVWAATFNGLFVIDPLSRKVQRINNTTEKNNPPQNQFNFINQLQDGRMLASSNAGLFLISKKKNQYFFSRVKNCPANDVYLTSFQDSDGIIYISRAFKGFYTCRLQQDSLVAQHDYTYQASIKCFAETNDSLVWIGSTIGLMRYNKNQHRIQKIYTTSEGLSNQYIYAVLAHKEYLWMSTNAGLSRLNSHNNEVKNFSAADGLQSNEFNTYSFCKTTGQEMLFGGVNGLNAFYPDLVTPYKNKPQLQLATLQVNDSLYNPGINPGELESLGLQYKQNTISFQFTVLDYANAAASNCCTRSKAMIRIKYWHPTKP